MRTRGAHFLIHLATALSLGHHVDHVIRGNHTGWPLTEQVTPFTYSLAVYPLILLGLHLSRSDKVGTGYWLLLSGPGTAFLIAVHLGPSAIEPPGDIIGEYPTPLLGWAAFGWLLTLIAVLAATFVHEARQWRREQQRTRERLSPPQDVPGTTTARGRGASRPATAPRQPYKPSAGR